MNNKKRPLLLVKNFAESQLKNSHLQSTPESTDTGKTTRTGTTSVQTFHDARPGGCYRLAGTLTLLGLIAAPGAYGAPEGGSIAGGNGSIAQSGATTTITQNSARLAINWNSFSSKAGESIVFKQPGASAIALNRVVGTGASELSGSLSANGQVFILNPNGVLFGAGATVNAQGLMASTLDMDNASFMKGGQELLLENGGAAGSITNQGSLTANPGGYVALIAPKVINAGSISAQQGNAWMSAGDKVTLQMGDSGLMSVTINNGTLDALVDNRETGRISANGGNVNLEAKAAENIGAALVNHDGVIEAQTLNAVSGRVRLISDMQRGQLIMNGQIDVSAPVSGNGGAVETSAAKVKILDGAQLNARAREGVNGSWLIDPEDFSIVNNNDPLTDSSVGNQKLQQLIKDSKAGSFEIKTLASSGTGGDIFVNAPLDWSTNKLILTADRNIYINYDMTLTGNAGLVLQTAQNKTGIGEYFFNNAKINLTNGTTFATKRGSSGTSISYDVITALRSPSNTSPNPSLQAITGARNYVLGTDIDATETKTNPTVWGATGFTPIANFSGTLDGLGHRINGLYINRPSESGVGLFGTTTDTATIRNVKLVDADVTALGSAGILVGVNNGRISNASSTGKITGAVGKGENDGYYIGGLVGQNLALLPGRTPGNIDRSSSVANVTGTQGVGGLVGYMAGGASIDNSTASGTVTAIKQRNTPLQWFGGLLGVNIESTVSNSYAEADVSAAEMSRVGGLVGENGGLIRNSYAVGKVTGNSSVGGLAGIVSLSNGSVENSYAKASVNAGGTNPKFIGGLVGFMLEDKKVTNSYASGAVNVTGNDAEFVGGLIGYASSNRANVVSSYWNTDSIANGGTGIGPESGTKIGIGKTGKELMATGTFADNGWIISNAGGSTAVWRIYDGVTMPLLRNFMQDVTVDELSVTYNAAKREGALPKAPGLDFTAATGRNVGTYTPSSTQQGYDIAGGNLTITPAPVTFTLRDTVSKQYDGTTDVPKALNPVISIASGQLFKVKDQEDTYSGGTFAFNKRNASEIKDSKALADKTVIVSDVIVNDGNGGKNYQVTYQAKDGNTINRAPLTVTVTDITKTYDGTTSADKASADYKGLVGSDKPLPGIITFADRNADTNNYKQLNISSTGISDGNNGQNYDLTYLPSTKSRIIPAPLTVSIDNVVRTYDGTLDATAKPVVISGTLFGGQVFNGTLFPKDSLPDSAPVAFTNRNVVTGNKTVTVSGVKVDDGNGGNNYQVSYEPNRSSRINPAVLTVSTGNVAKTYDGTVNAPGATAAIVEGRLYADDTLNGGTFAFADRNAGIGNKTVNVSGITVNDRNDGNNYLLKLSPNMSSTISPAPLTVTANGDRKTYDTAPYKGGNGVVISGLASGETADVLGGQLGYGGSAQGALLPGSYRITPAGLQSQNYAISYASGTLQIDQPADLTSRVNMLDPMQGPGARQTPAIGGATVQVAGCGVSIPANALGVDCITASAQRGR